MTYIETSANQFYFVTDYAEGLQTVLDRIASDMRLAAYALEG